MGMTYELFFFSIQTNVMSGQCKGALLRIQIRYTAIFLLPGWIGSWCGGHIGLFTPRKTPDGYICTGFYFQPWLSPDKAIIDLPQWYVKSLRAISFRSD